MESTTFSGDLLLVDPSKSQVNGVRIYLSNLNDGLMIKLVEWLFYGSIVVCGDNIFDSKNSIYLAVLCE